MMSTDSLRCFVEAARLLNFRAAARVVALSPAALGQRIRQLEEELGAALFVRTTRAVTLTEAGLRFRPRADAALRALAACLELGPEESPRLEIELGTRHELGVSWVQPALRSAKRAWPGLEVHLYVGSGADLVHRVRGHELDCAVSSSPLVDPKLAALPLHEERYSMVAATSLLREHPLRNATDAGRHTLFDTTEDLPLFRYWRDVGTQLDSTDFGSVVRLGAIELIRASVRVGEGVAVLPHYYVDADLRARKLTRLFPRVVPRTDTFRLFFRADDARRPLFAKLAGILASRPLA